MIKNAISLTLAIHKRDLEEIKATRNVWNEHWTLNNAATRIGHQGLSWPFKFMQTLHLNPNRDLGEYFDWKTMAPKVPPNGNKVDSEAKCKFCFVIVLRRFSFTDRVEPFEDVLKGF